MDTDTIKALKQPIPLMMLAGGIVVGLFIAYFVFGTEASGDRSETINNIQLTMGMGYEDVKRKLGEPDVVIGGDTEDFSTSYGPFGTHHPRNGHQTKYRLTLKFKQRKLHGWMRTTPTNRD